MIEAGADVMIPSKEGNMLHYACRHGDVFLLKKLLERGVDLYAKDRRALWGHSPLKCAAESGNIEIVRLLVEHGLDVHEKDLWGREASQYELVKEYMASVEVRIATEVDLPGRDAEDATRMDAAVYRDLAEI